MGKRELFFSRFFLLHQALVFDEIFFAKYCLLVVSKYQISLKMLHPVKRYSALEIGGEPETPCTILSNGEKKTDNASIFR